MDYYTRMPRDAKFQRITALAQKVAGNAKTPVDKVLAIRDYFLSKDEDGNPLYSYTDNPGVPDIPSASKLMYFLFDNHKGYCAYYAGATLFMLRSLGIPSRITVGFLTIDRSDKNKGWYWYYADQAHAWVQVYFPGYGWLDFDTTVGDDEAQQSPSPDGTPPMQPPHAWFASEGEIVAVDTLRKTVKLKTGQILFHDKEYTAKQGGAEVLLDVSIANIQRDSVNISITQVKPGDSATAVSYAEVLKKLPDGQPGASAESILARIPSPLPTDDVYLKKTPQQVKEELLQQQKAEQPFSYRKLLLTTGLVILLFLCFFFTIPSLILAWYRFRSRNAATVEHRAYWQYRGLGFYLHQLGFYRGAQTPLRYAADTIDARFGTPFTRFMNVFLKTKYTDRKLSAADATTLAVTEQQTIQQIKAQIPAGKRLNAFLRPLRSFTYLNHKNQT
ncbi:MAG TPA: transglutaminase-like domain-containing protein [Chitinophagaceae bacterium]|nr:transglutaminase-like domain-containing protein [Chitinophagaceae bacterium]